MTFEEEDVFENDDVTSFSRESHIIEIWYGVLRHPVYFLELHFWNWLKNFWEWCDKFWDKYTRVVSTIIYWQDYVGRKGNTLD